MGSAGRPLLRERVSGGVVLVVFDVSRPPPGRNPGKAGKTARTGRRPPSPAARAASSSTEVRCRFSGSSYLIVYLNSWQSLQSTTDFSCSLWQAVQETPAP